MTENEKTEHHQTEVWTRVITGCVGAIVVGLQGVNISETSGQTVYIQKIDRALEQQVALTKSLDQEGKQIDQALANQQHLIESMDVVLKNQTSALELLKAQRQ